MNREDIIRMAREAGLDPDLWNYTDAFERFASLVAAHERETEQKTAVSPGKGTGFNYFRAIEAKLKEKNT